MKRSAAGQLNKAYLSTMQKQQITVQECYEIMGLFFVNEDIIISWTELLDLKQSNYETFLTETERKSFKADMVREFAFMRERL